MALTYDLTGCADCKALLTKHQSPVTDAIIWLTMFTGIGWSVTEGNADEFYARIALLERLSGPMLRMPARTPSGRLARRDGQPFTVPYHITPEDVRRYIGLRVNVAPEPRVKWLKRICSIKLDDLRREFRDAVVKADEEALTRV